MSAEIYIFSPRDEYLGTLTEENGLLKALLKDKLNNVSSEPLTIEFESDSDVAVHIKDEHRIVVKDREGKFREYVIKEEDDLNDFDGPISEVICFPSFMYELSKKIIVDRRFVDKGPEEAWQAALNGTRFEGEVIGSFGKATTNFYYLSSVEALWKARDVWGGDIESIVELNDDNTHIERRIMNLRLRLGADRGARFEVGHNTKEIQRTVLSDPVTALYGRGASLEILDEEGNPTGGHTRYIDFGDVEWKKSNGDPVDKPKGQKWVGDPDALLKYGLEEDGQLIHLEDIYSNQNIEDEEELLAFTWDHLQESQTPEVNYKLNVELIDEYVELGDTAAAIDREFARPIEIQSRVIAIQYDLMDIEETTEVEMGQHLALDDADDKLKEELEHIKESLNKPRPTKPIDEDSFPDIKPMTPPNVEAEGLFETIMLTWDYDFAVYVSHYEVYGSQVEGFVPDSQHLLWRGDVSSFLHDVEGDQQWYYRVRAVNTRGTTSDWSPQVTASSRRIMSTDILFGEIKAEHLAENLELADKLSQGTVDWINEAPLQSAQDALDKALEGLYTAQDALGEAGQSFSLAQEAFDQAQENATILDSLALRIQSNNLISHSRVFSAAQSGDLFVYFGWDANASGDDLYPIKVEGGKTYTFKDFSVLEYADYPGGPVDYTLACFSSEDTNTAETFQLPGNKDSLTFTVPTGMDRVMITASYIVPEEEPYPELLVGTKVKVKLVEGEHMDDWTLHDEDPYLQYTTITGTVDGLQTEVSDIDGNLTTVTQLAQGLESQVSDNTGNIANVTLVAEGLQSTLTDVEGNVSNLLQTSTQFESRLTSVENWEIGGRNLILATTPLEENTAEWVTIGSITTGSLGAITVEEGSERGEYFRLGINNTVETGDNPRFRSKYVTLLRHGQTYTASWKAFHSDWVSSDPYGGIYDNNGIIRQNFRNASKKAIGTVLYNGFTKTVYQYSITFTLDYELADEKRFGIYLGATYTRSTSSAAYVLFKDIQLEEGTKATAWSPAPEDMATHAQVSLISQEIDNIQLSVVDIKDDLGDAQGRISLIDQKADNISLSINSLEGDLSNWGVGGRNLLAYSLMEDYGFFWVTNTNTAVPIPEGTTHITYSRQGSNPFASSDNFAVSFLPSKNGTAIRTEDFTPSTTARTTTVPANAKYLLFAIFSDGMTLNEIKKAKFQVEAGQKKSPYSLAYEDAIEVTSSLAFINLSEDGIRLHGSKVQISGQTQIEDAVIGSAAIADAAIKRAHLQNAIIDTAHITDAAITSAKIGNLAVTTAKIGTAAVTNAKIASLSVDKLTGSIATFIREGFNGITSQVEITGTGLETYSGGQRTSLLDGSGHNFYRNNKKIGHIGTSSFEGDANYRGLRFGLEYDANYMTWSYKSSAGASTLTPMLIWSRTGAKNFAKGFEFTDNVTINSTNTFINTYFRSNHSTARIISLKNETFSSYEGVAIRRDSNRDGDGAGLFLTGARAIISVPNAAGSSIHNTLELTRNYLNALPIAHNSSSDSPNVRVSSSGRLYITTSASKYKLLIENEESKGYNYSRILDLSVKSWYDKSSMEKHAGVLEGNLSEEEADLHFLKRNFGLIAEDVERAGLSEFVTYHTQTQEIEGIEYDRLWILLIPTLRDHIERTDEKFDQIALKYDILKQRATHLEQRVSHLEQLLEVSR